MSKKLFDKNISGKIFKPTFRNDSKGSASYLNKPENKDYSYSNFKDTNLYSTSSYRYGDKNYLVSTQQANIDYSRFENHTFFHSAVANVNEAFDRIINFYPFDGTKKQIEEFEDTLTGFEKYVLDSFPKNVGYLFFSGTQIGELKTNGNYIEVIDRSGASISSISSDRTSKISMDPLKSPFVIELFCKSPEKINDNQILVQKRSSLSSNFTLALTSSSDATKTSVVFGITSGSNYSYVTGTLHKGKFNHIAAIYDPHGDQKTKLLIDDIIYSSSMSTVFETLNYNGASLFVGSGNQVRLNNVIFDQRETFSGSIDSLRLFHNFRSRKLINYEKTRDIYNDENLKLLFKFNEPSGSYSGNDITIDSSGNSLHSRVENYNHLINRATGSDNPTTNEMVDRNIVLFPDQEHIRALNSRLLITGSEYDDYNPNLITKLVPPHYFHQASVYDNFDNELGKLGEAYSTFTDNNIGKKESELPGAQILVKFLLTWAKFFDEIKITIDTISNYNHISYNDYETVPDPFLKNKGRSLNITLPSLFRSANLSQLIDGINLNKEYSNSIKTLNQIQNLVWRRILSDSTNLKLTKGTIDSMKSIFRSSGIEPDNILVFREYGGSKLKSLNSSRERKIDVIKFLNFSGSNNKEEKNIDTWGYPLNFPKIKSGFLSGSRVEVGNPVIAGNFVSSSSIHPHGISNNTSDGLYTSGSFTFEGLYDWEGGYKNDPESLIRINVTGSSAPNNIEACTANLVGASGSLNLFVRDSPTSNEVKHLFIKGVNVFDKDPWYVSFGRKNSHDIGPISQRSEYFLRAAKQENGEILETHQTSSHYPNVSDSVFNNISSEYNASGSFLVIGKQIFSGSSYTKFLNDNNTGKVNTLAHSSSFSGLVTNLRFWSKNTSKAEWLERVKNYVSVGSDNPLINYNFTKTATGSFERLILQTSCKQATTGSDASGNIRFFDFTKNNLHFSGSNFEINKSVFKPIRSDYEILSDKFDINFAKTKIRIRSFQNVDMLSDSNYAGITPVYEVSPSEEVVDDNRLSIDMSVMKGLNENIMTIFSNFDPLDNALGKPNLLFGESYPELNKYRDIYFNNILEKIDLKKYRGLFKWIDNAFTDVMYNIVPRTTNFLGINFIYESHVLERNRFRYGFDEIYLKSLPRDPSRGNLRLSQFIAKVDKY